MQCNSKRSFLLFVEGFFDAEGCVKIINDKARKVPKICLDICNTNYDFLKVCRKILKRELGIIARYSVQKGEIGKDGHRRKTSYHLRIYKKDFVRKFFENVSTSKLYPHKAELLENWLKR